MDLANYIGDLNIIGYNLNKTRGRANKENHWCPTYDAAANSGQHTFHAKTRLIVTVVSASFRKSGFCRSVGLPWFVCRREACACRCVRVRSGDSNRQGRSTPGEMRRYPF
jgi:hypothetical protein